MGLHVYTGPESKEEKLDSELLDRRLREGEEVDLEDYDLSGYGGFLAENRVNGVSEGVILYLYDISLSDLEALKRQKKRGR